MRHRHVIATLAAAAVCTLAQAQVAAPPPLAASGPALRPPAPPPGPRPAPVDTAPATRLDGTIARWLSNPNGEADGLLLADGTQVAFPPHLSARLVDTVKPKDAVQLTGVREGAVFRATEVRAKAGGRSVRDDGPPATPPAPRDPAALQALSAAGRITTLLQGPRGDVHGVVLQGGEIVRFPPPVGRQYAALLQPGATLHARGYGTRNALGTAFEATALGPSAERVQDVFAAPPAPRP